MNIWAEEPDTPEDLYARKEAFDLASRPDSRMDARALRVCMLRLEGHTLPETAAAIGFSVKTVIADLERVKRHGGSIIEPIRPELVAHIRNERARGVSTDTLHYRNGLSREKVRAILGMP